MKRRTIVIMLSALLLSDCMTQPSEGTLGNMISNACGEKNNCKVDMKLLVKKRWDKMYVFREGAPRELVNRVIGFEYPYFGDVAKRIIFTKDGQVVYHEDEFPSFDGVKEGELMFNLVNRDDYKVFSPDEAIFNIRKVPVGNESYYELTQASPQKRR